MLFEILRNQIIVLIDTLVKRVLNHPVQLMRDINAKVVKKDIIKRIIGAKSTSALVTMEKGPLELHQRCFGCLIEK